MEFANKDLKKLCKIREFFGFDKQLDKTKEELVELKNAIDAYKKDKTKGLDNYLEEMADVHIMLQQLIQELTFEEYNTLYMIVGHKIDRTLERIKEGYYGE